MPRDKTNAHQRIIKAATAEFLEHGFENASMRRIAENSGITAGALYKHFVNKEDMFSALVEPTITELMELFDKMQTESLEQLLRSGSTRYGRTTAAMLLCSCSSSIPTSVRSG